MATPGTSEAARGIRPSRLIRPIGLLLIWLVNATLNGTALAQQFLQRSSLHGRRLFAFALATATAATVATGAGGDRSTPDTAPHEGICELPGADRARTPSQRCIACHDGTVGPGVTFEMSARGNSMSHPVEVDYAEAALRHAGRYVSSSEIPPEVPLVNGRVACTSCHDGASSESKRVVDPMKLCYACHRL